MLAIGYVAAFVGGLWLPAMYIRSQASEEINFVFACLSLFCVINTMICLWEISLYFYIENIQRNYAGKIKRLSSGKLGDIFLFEEVEFSKAFTLKYWHEVWATYSLVDPSYSDTRSFGWNIDIGNGFSTLLPTVLFLYYISFQPTYQSDLFFGLDCKVIGLISFVTFYQEFYGTILYFNQYITNKQWKNHNNSLRDIFLLVVCSNITWLFGPSLGMYVSYGMMFNDKQPYYVIN